MAKVAITVCKNYESSNIEKSMSTLISLLGELKETILPGQKVLLKVNMLNASSPERAVTTHPEILRCVIKNVKKRGGIVTVGDSPGGRNVGASPQRVFETTGIEEVCRDEDVPLILFDKEVVKIESLDAKLYSSFQVGKAVVDADLVITIPRLKTHGFQMFTGAVKNLFGAIPGLKKAEYHLKVPDRDNFGEMLIDLYQSIDPGLAIMDGIVAMEGEGPSSGSPYHLGLILASVNPIALDFVASKIIGLDPFKVYSTKAALKRGLLDPDVIEVVGEGLDKVCVDDFTLARTEAGLGLPPFVRSRLNDVLIDKPALQRSDDCDGCSTCCQNCPVDSIKMDKGKPKFDYDECIRCYCCQELCPEYAIGLKKHWVVRGWQMVRGKE